MIWFTLALFVVSFILTALLAPKPKLENARARSLDDVDFPRATENAPIPLVLGTIRMAAPNVIWYGNFKTVPIKEKVKTGLFSSKKVIVGYRYFLSMDMALAMGEGVTLREIYVDDKLAWSGDTGGGAAYSLSGVGISFGGYKEGGAMNMGGTFYSGSFDIADQPVDTFIEGLVGSGGVPAYLGTSHLVLDGELGESAQLRKMAFVLERFTNQLGLVNNGQIGVDMNPAEAIYQLMTDTWNGLGLSPSIIDITTLQNIGQVLYDESNGVSVQVTAETDGKTVLNEILRQIDGVAYQDPETGKIIFKLIREDYDVDLLDTYDEDSILKINNFSRSGWDEVIAQVKVSFPQRDKESDAVAISQDMATAGMIGRLRSTTISMPFCYDATLANKIASRERAQLSVPLFRMTIEMNRNGNRLRPGDVFKVNWPDYSITSIVMRVQQFDFGSLLEGKLVVQCLQDNFALSDVVLAPPPESNWVAPVVAPEEILVQELLEMPRFFMNRVQFPIADGKAGVIPLALKPSTASSSFDLLSGIVSGDLDVREPQQATYLTTGNLLAEYDRMEGFVTGVDSVGFDVINVVGEDGFLPAGSLTELREGETGLLYANGEFMGFTSAVDNMDGSWTISNVYRGLLGTSPKTHPINTRVWQITPELYGEGNQDNLSETGTLYYKLLDRVGPSAIDPDDITQENQTMARFARRPQRVRNLQLDGNRNSFVANNSTGVTTVSWARSDREASLITIETDPDETPDISDALAEEYDIELYHEGVLIYSDLAQPGPTSDTINFGAYTLSGDGEIRVIPRWEYNPAADVFAFDYSFLPFTWDQVLLSAAYKNAGNHVIIESGTSINIPYPTSLNAGDLLLLTIMARSDVMTPTGWVLLERQDGPLNRIYIFGRRSNGTESGNITISQAVANRFIGQIAAFEGYSGVPSFYTEVEGTNLNQSPPFTAGSSVIDYDDTIVFTTMANHLSKVGITIEIEAGYTQISPITINQNRLGIGISAQRDIGTDDPGIVWTSNVGGSTNNISFITGHITDAFDVKLFNYPNTPTGGILYRFENDHVWEDILLSNSAENGDLIMALTDLSGNSQNATQGSTGFSPTYDLTNRDAIFATNNRMITSELPNAAQGSFFARFRANTGATGTQTFIGSANGSNRAWISLTNGIASMGLGSVGSNMFQDLGIVDLRSATDWHTIVSTWDGTDMFLYVDGVQVNTTAKAGTISNQAMYIGGRHTGSGLVDNFFNGDIFAVGYIDRTLTATEVAILDQYYRLAQTS